MRDQLLLGIAIVASFSCVLWYSTSVFRVSTQAFRELCKVEEIVADIASRLGALQSDIERNMRCTRIQKRKNYAANITQIEQELEKVLEFLDSIHGNDKVRRKRKAIADQITLAYLNTVDELRDRVGEDML
ncbi:unnamed protein product [Albugo candida]|uniref:BAG domain-containing protein n=1 Tax=Albugo candida TaxID=65357 RepID=A0A024GRQ7_9STRA|nr:unnamed protein product [Albugo candida]|eukprot:CCI49440.1 unnamed protein product [Albugo candida]